MGLPRSDFRPDKQVEKAQINWCETSTQKQVMKVTHHMRQRRFNRKISNFMDDGE